MPLQICTCCDLNAGDKRRPCGFPWTTANNVEFADQPTTPESLTVARSSDYTSATMGWTLYDAVTEYEIERSTAVQVNVADASRIEYGDPVTYMITGTQAGIDEYTDSTIEAHRTYQYRIRARGADAASWSAWSNYVFSGAAPKADLPAPANLELVRDSDSVTASWSAPSGDFDNYTLQRQELIVVSGSTFFANVVTLGDDMWLPANSTMYVDTGIMPEQTYEYRVGAVLDDQVGVYSEWFRVGPVDTSLGGAPGDLRIVETGARVFDQRREFWMRWDEIGRADDYQLQVVAYDLTGGGRSLSDHVVTDPTYFRTAFSSEALRVRGRKLDADVCAGADDDRCVTGWTPWYDVSFTPKVSSAGSPDGEQPGHDDDGGARGAARGHRGGPRAGRIHRRQRPRSGVRPAGLCAVRGIDQRGARLASRHGAPGSGHGRGDTRAGADGRLPPAGDQHRVADRGPVADWSGRDACPGAPARSAALMVLQRMLIALVAMHLGFGFTQLSLAYYAGDVADYGAAGFLSHTPIGAFVDLDEDNDQTSGANLSAIRQMFEIVNQTGDAINGLASFGYDFLDEIGPDVGLVYMVVLIFRIASWLFTIALGLALLYVLFDSNLLTSKVGLALVAGGSGLVALLSGAGALL